MKTVQVVAVALIALACAAFVAGCTYHEHYYMGEPVSKTYVE